MDVIFDQKAKGQGQTELGNGWAWVAVFFASICHLRAALANASAASALVTVPRRDGH